jgi:hypothetical protein
VSVVASAGTTLAISTQKLSLAGQPVLFRTNAASIARYAREFFPELRDAQPVSTPVRATITVHVRETDEPCKRNPWFRARGHFAFARFTRADSFWFNLRTREVYGTCSAALADDRTRWRTHIFPALLGILAATIGVAPVHAACIGREEGGILLAGPSGAGKSTLTIAMARRGHALLSDDWTYLSAAEGGLDSSAVIAWGLPVPVKLLPDADFFFPELRAYRTEESLNGEVAYEVCPEECFAISRLSRCRVTALVWLERMTKRGCSIVPIEAEEAIHHLETEVEPLEGTLAPCYRKQIDLIRRLGTISCYRVAFNDHPDKVAEAVDQEIAALG